MILDYFPGFPDFPRLAETLTLFKGDTFFKEETFGSPNGVRFGAASPCLLSRPMNCAP